MGSASLWTGEAGAVTSSLDLDRELVDAVSTRFAARLRGVTDSDSAYWDYSGIKSNSNPLAYFQYPAMMVPRMQGDIIKALVEVFPRTKRTFDPFAGSGTVLTESLKLGLSSIALDVNPMAILLCKVKAAGFRELDATSALKEVLQSSAKDRAECIEITYHNREKWFCAEALRELSKVCRTIKLIEDLELRQLLWMAFAEAVRINSNSRTSTYKLHIRDADDIQRRSSGARDRIVNAMERVVAMYTHNAQALANAGSTKAGRFKKSVTIRNHDIREPVGRYWADALITSPPYGDNHTTVTYGQHSFLPLCWIPFLDIDPTLDTRLVENTHSIDSASLGGRKEGSALKQTKIIQKSNSLRALLASPLLNVDAKQRLSIFFHDLDVALENSLRILRAGSPIVLTLGNRCVGGQKVPMDSIVRELLENNNCVFIDTHNRAIPTKRMAHRNQSAGTMLTETLLIMRGPSN
ncbi:MAG: DNA adenine methylase [Fimbriimonadales bacterium]